MTFRDFSKVVRKDQDNLSEHNFSVISNRDIENINDITIVFTEERRSEAYRDSLIPTDPAENLDFFEDNTHTGTNYKQQYLPYNISGVISGINQDTKARPFEISTTANVVSKSSKMMYSEMDDFLTRTNKVNGIKI
jgi:hypothetical protein